MNCDLWLNTILRVKGALQPFLQGAK